LYVAPNIIRVIKSKRRRRVGHVARMEEMRDKTFWSENLKGRDYLEELGVDGRKILERILGKYGAKV
jgi:hypothetical protein